MAALKTVILYENHCFCVREDVKSDLLPSLLELRKRAVKVRVCERAQAGW
jgi:hypothetical protein